MASSSVVLDASALLAALWQEPGSDAVYDHLEEAVMSTVNLAEVIGKLAMRNLSSAQIEEVLAACSFEVVPLSDPLARKIGLLEPETRKLGLSLADRACLALAMEFNAPALTADRAWLKLDLGVEIICIRN